VDSPAEKIPGDDACACSNQRSLFVLRGTAPRQLAMACLSQLCPLVRLPAACLPVCPVQMLAYTVETVPCFVLLDPEGEPASCMAACPQASLPTGTHVRAPALHGKAVVTQGTPTALHMPLMAHRICTLSARCRPCALQERCTTKPAADGGSPVRDGATCQQPAAQALRGWQQGVPARAT